jgi:hypothetical protein
MYICYKNIDTEKALPTKFTDDVKNILDTETYIEVANIPNAEIITGKSAQLFLNLSTNELYYEYVDRPLTIEEKLEKIQVQSDTLSLEILKIKGLA